MKMRRRNNSFWTSKMRLPILVFLFVFIWACSCFGFSEAEAGKFVQKGFSYAGWERDCYSLPSSDVSLENLSCLGVEWVALIVTWYQDSKNSTKIYPHPQWTPADEGLIRAIKKAHSLRMKVMLKPHLDCWDGTFRGEIEFLREADWKVWFKSYQDFILHYAKLAQEQKVEQFCLGCELRKTTSREADWKKIIKALRKEFKGSLVYAANWDEYSRVKFWSLLDYAGIDAYFPLDIKEKPTVKELKKFWRIWLRGVEEWQGKVKKRVILTEIGYRSIKGASRAPGDWKVKGEVDLEEQANCYQAALEIFFNKPWLAGVYWWSWDPRPEQGGKTDTGYTIYKKPAENIIKQWYEVSP